MDLRTIHTTNDYIDGDKFSRMSHFAITEFHRGFCSEMREKNCIIFCKTDYLGQLFHFLNGSKNKVILITHNSDYEIGSVRYHAKPRCIKKWFAENVNYQADDLIPIPLGIERPGVGTSSDTSVLKMVFDRSDISTKNMVYMNQNNDTNLEERKPVLEMFKDVRWVSTKNHRVDFLEFLMDVKSHKFVLAPRGNGIDTHRVWEALYLRTIPIVTRSLLMESFSKILPILMVDRWEDVTEEYLLNISRVVYQKRLVPLSFTYWKNIIEDSFLKLESE